MTKEQTKRVYTAMHYDTNENLKTSISSVTAADVLSPKTDYTAYIFSAEQIIQRLNFRTLAIPAAADWGAESLTTFVAGSFPYRDSQYQVYVERGEFLLVPFFYHRTPINGVLTSTQTTSDANTSANTCNSSWTICAPTSSSGDKEVRIFPQQQHIGIKANGYHSPILAIKKPDAYQEGEDKNIWKISDGSLSPAVFTILYQ